MAGNTDAGATPAAAGATPAQSEPQGSTVASAKDDLTDEEIAALGDPGKRALDRMKQSQALAADQAKAEKGRADKAERELQALRQASMSESEKRDARLAELEQQQSDWERERQDWQTRESVTHTALRLGYADPADAYSLIDRASLEFDDSGKPRNVDKLLTDLIAAKPYLAGASRPGGSFDGGPRGAAASGNTMNDILRGARSGRG